MLLRECADSMSITVTTALFRTLSNYSPVAVTRNAARRVSVGPISRASHDVSRHVRCSGSRVETVPCESSLSPS